MRRIEANEPIELRPVIEVEPYAWSDRELPEGPAAETPEAWLAQFHQCMADAGITGIEPIQPGSCFVDAFAVVSNELILRMIRAALEQSGLPGFPDESGNEAAENTDVVAMLAGGYALMGAGAILLEPECCSDFSNLASWQEALAERHADGTIWIGHPEARIAFDGDAVTIAEGYEAEPAPDHLVQFTLPVPALEKAVMLAEASRDQLHAKLLHRVTEVVGDAQAAAVCDALMAVY